MSKIADERTSANLLIEKEMGRQLHNNRSIEVFDKKSYLGLVTHLETYSNSPEFTRMTDKHFFVEVAAAAQLALESLIRREVLKEKEELLNNKRIVYIWLYDVETREAYANEVYDENGELVMEQFPRVRNVANDKTVEHLLDAYADNSEYTSYIEVRKYTDNTLISSHGKRYL